MSDKIGVLGRASATTVGTTTVYTCPAGKAARGRWMCVFQGGVNSQVALLVAAMEVARNAAMTTGQYNYSIRGGGMYAYAASNAALPSGLADALTVAPASPIYYLNAGDTVQYTVITAALLAANFQFVGTEIDV